MAKIQKMLFFFFRNGREDKIGSRETTSGFANDNSFPIYSSKIELYSNIKTKSDLFMSVCIFSNTLEMSEVKFSVLWMQRCRNLKSIKLDNS